VMQTMGNVMVLTRQRRARTGFIREWSGAARTDRDWSSNKCMAYVGVPSLPKEDIVRRFLGFVFVALLLGGKNKRRYEDSGQRRAAALLSPLY